MLLPLLAACGAGEPAPKDLAAEPATYSISEADAAKAVELFESQACTVCHGEMGVGVEGAGPALKDLAPYWNEDRLEAYLEDPEAFREAHPDFEDRRAEQYDLQMPAFGHLTADERQLLAHWLLTR